MQLCRQRVLLRVLVKTGQEGILLGFFQQQLGQLDIIIDAPPEPEPDPAGEIFADDEFMDDFPFPMEGEAGITGTSYWFNSYRLDEVAAIHDYLDGLPETGKVLSIVTATRMLEQLNEGKPIDDFFLSVLFHRTS